MANRKGWLRGISFSTVTYACGPLAPEIQYGFKLTHDAYVNVVWDCLYGIGFEIAYLIVGNIALNGFAFLLGVIVWPTLLFWTMAYLVKRLCSTRWRTRYLVGIALVFIGTLLFYVPLKSVGKDGRPTFCADVTAVVF
jgi:hypothetical protein